jgi:hypothetical protein
MTPLSGARVLAPIFGATTESYWVPALACTEYATTDPNGLKGNSSLFSESSCAGSVTLQKVGQRSQLNLDMTGGGFYYNRPYEQENKQYGTAGQLSLFDQINGGRWNLTLGDMGSYLPEGSIGYNPFAGLASFAGGMGGGAAANAPALNSGLSPNQSIYGGVARRFSDLALTDFSYMASARTTITGTMMFGTQQYLEPGNIDERSWTASSGFNYVFGRSQEFALTYEEMHFNFGAGEQSFFTRGASFLYGRPVGRKFTVELSVAPTARTVTVPQEGSTTGFYLGTYDSLELRGERWSGMLRFNRTLTGGAGVLAGASRDQVYGEIGRQLTRRVHGAVTAGYSENKSVAQTQSGPQPEFSYVEAGANLTHEFTPHVSMYLNYNVQHQTSNTPLCQAAGCSTLYFRQIAGFGISWHARPIKIQ